jgi:hypothetical protein
VLLPPEGPSGVYFGAGGTLRRTDSGADAQELVDWRKIPGQNP